MGCEALYLHSLEDRPSPYPQHPWLAELREVHRLRAGALLHGVAHGRGGSALRRQYGGVPAPGSARGRSAAEDRCGEARGEARSHDGEPPQHARYQRALRPPLARRSISGREMVKNKKIMTGPAPVT